MKKAIKYLSGMKSRCFMYCQLRSSYFYDMRQIIIRKSITICYIISLFHWDYRFVIHMNLHIFSCRISDCNRIFDGYHSKARISRSRLGHPAEGLFD